MQFSIQHSFDDNLILDNIKGEILTMDKIALIGNNGVGKTTLLKCLVEKYSDNNLFFWAKQISIKDIPDQTMFEYLSQISDEWWMILNNLNKFFGTDLDESHSINSLSGGELCQLQVTMAITSTAKILLLDEPTNHLDTDSQRKLIKILSEEKRSIVTVSHNRDFIDSFANKIWYLENKKLFVSMVII